MNRQTSNSSEQAMLLDYNYSNDERRPYSFSDKGSVITFQNIYYNIPKRASYCFTKSEEKLILKDLNGVFKPGMNGIMGPTGGGKTSLLDILAGRKDPRYKSGVILIDGRDQPYNFKTLVGYVQQQDVLFGSMTVRENLNFAANLKLPMYISKVDREKCVNTVIRELNLTDCVNTYIGTEFLRGVSGGEKKRTAIGMALINQPSVLFLDEPTTGLDASTAYSVMCILAKLANSGKTIIFSIHQPRYSIFKMIDYLVLIKQGEMIYQGRRKDILDYFQKYGYECEQNNNPADFVLDIITGDEKSNLEITFNLIDNYNYSDEKKIISEEINELVSSYDNELTHILSKKGEFVASFRRQISTLSKRSYVNIFRNPAALVIQISTTIITALIIGIIYFQIDNTFKTGIYNRMGLFYFVSVNLMFSNNSALEVFLNDRIMLINENTSGYYRTSAFFITKLIFDILLMRLIPILVFGIIVYWMVGLDSDISKFFLFLLNMFLATICSTAIVLFASATFTTQSVCNLLTTSSFVMMMIFSGMLININSIKPVINWLKYFSVIRYTLVTFLITELKDKQFCSLNRNGTEICASGNLYLSDQGIPYKTPWDYYSNFLSIFLIYFIVIIFTYIQLRRINKYK